MIVQRATGPVFFEREHRLRWRVHVQQRARRRRVRRRHLIAKFKQALAWRARFSEFPQLVNESPHLLKLARTIYQAELTFQRELKSLGVTVTGEAG